jgi:hypothetical protein
VSEGWSIYEGTDPEFARRMQAMIAASGGRITIVSAYRSREKQQSLYQNAIKKYGSEEAARKWVAPPGRSNHNHGLAIDLDYNGDGKQWAHENAARFGLTFPMGHEPWHIEPIGVRDGSFKPGHEHSDDAYTIPPPGIPNGWDAPRTMDTHMANFMGILMNPSGVEQAVAMRNEMMGSSGNDMMESTVAYEDTDG